MLPYFHIFDTFSFDKHNAFTFVAFNFNGVFSDYTQQFVADTSLLLTGFTGGIKFFDIKACHITSPPKSKYKKQNCRISVLL